MKSKRLSVTPLLLGFIAGLLAAAQSRADDTTSWKEVPFLRELASYHAPVIFQGVGHSPQSDIFTRFDFDGDFNGENNWDHTKKFAKPSIVYYDVIETPTHYFITYNLFYPRDYSFVCFWWICHENDSEGMRITVEKDGSRYGKVWLLETLAHYGMDFDERPMMTAPPAGYPEAGNPKVTVVSERMGHGLHSYNQYEPDKKHIVYFHAEPEQAAPRSDSGIGTYSLMPIWKLWEHRDEVGHGKMFYGTYNHEGARFKLGELPKTYAGKVWSDNEALPPWAWEPNNDKLHKGDWFLDPADSICKITRCPAIFAKDYVYHPYIGIMSRPPEDPAASASPMPAPEPMPTPMPTSADPAPPSEPTPASDPAPGSSA